MVAGGLLSLTALLAGFHEKRQGIGKEVVMLKKLIWNDVKQNKLMSTATVFFMAISACAADIDGAS